MFRFLIDQVVCMVDQTLDFLGASVIHNQRDGLSITRVLIEIAPLRKMAYRWLIHVKSPFSIQILAGASIEHEVYISALRCVKPEYNCLDWIGIFSGATVDVIRVIFDALLNVLANSFLGLV